MNFRESWVTGLKWHSHQRVWFSREIGVI